MYTTKTCEKKSKLRNEKQKKKKKTEKISKQVLREMHPVIKRKHVSVHLNRLKFIGLQTQLLNVTKILKHMLRC